MATGYHWRLSLTAAHYRMPRTVGHFRLPLATAVLLLCYCLLPHAAAGYCCATTGYRCAIACYRTLLLATAGYCRLLLCYRWLLLTTAGYRQLLPVIAGYSSIPQPTSWHPVVAAPTITSGTSWLRAAQLTVAAVGQAKLALPWHALPGEPLRAASIPCSCRVRVVTHGQPHQGTLPRAQLPAVSCCAMHAVPAPPHTTLAGECPNWGTCKCHS